jgi:hypothetical protein
MALILSAGWTEENSPEQQHQRQEVAELNAVRSGYRVNRRRASEPAAPLHEHDWLLYEPAGQPHEPIRPCGARPRRLCFVQPAAAARHAFPRAPRSAQAPRPIAHRSPPNARAAPVHLRWRVPRRRSDSSPQWPGLLTSNRQTIANERTALTRRRSHDAPGMLQGNLCSRFFAPWRTVQASHREGAPHQTTSHPQLVRLRRPKLPRPRCQSRDGALDPRPARAGAFGVEYRASLGARSPRSDAQRTRTPYRCRVSSPAVSSEATEEAFHATDNGPARAASRASGGRS